MRIVILIACLALFGCSQMKEDKRPNILLIVADDLGYTDLGCFGGEINTPNLDQLANEGMRFTRFHASPYCATTRAMLLTGNDNHVAGMGVQGMRTEEWGYEGKLSDRVLTIPQILKANGYSTFMAGKWHLGGRDGEHPVDKGFDKAFSIAYGGANHYSDRGIFSGVPVTKYIENGAEVPWPEGAYSTDFYTDKLIEFIETRRDKEQPFFAFAAYTSPHWPLQVDEHYSDKYAGLYDSGYDQLRQVRFDSSVSAGLVPKDAKIPPLHPGIIPWDSLSLEEKKIESRKMELYAGMVDNLDHNIGRLLNYIRSIGELEDTLIIFISDNGAAPEDFYNHENLGPFIRKNYSIDYEDMGKETSFISYGKQWAESGSAPFRYYKGYPTEGGMLAPLIIAGKSVAGSGSINEDFVTLLDVAPSLYELTGSSYPDSMSSQYPLLGSSFLGLIEGTSVRTHNDDYVFAFEHINKSMLRKGNWKIVSYDIPFQKENFALYNLSSDLSEGSDLKDEYPKKYQELLEEWDNFVETNKIQNPYPGDEDF